MEKKPGKTIKIAITGPESTGKTSLASELAGHYNTVYVPEFAREYLEGIDREYTEEDLVAIARGQRKGEKQALEGTNQILFCDTDMIVMKIWSMAKYKRVHPKILEWLEKEDHSFYLLCYPDLQWVEDPLRENPDKGHHFFNQYQEELTRLNLPFSVIKGKGNERMQNAIEAIEQWKNEH